MESGATVHRPSGAKTHNARRTVRAPARIPGTIRPVKLGGVGLGKGADQRAHAVRIGQRKAWMAGECAHALEGRHFRDGGLERKPFVDHERVTFIALVELLERLGALGHLLLKDGEPEREVNRDRDRGQEAERGKHGQGA